MYDKMLQGMLVLWIFFFSSNFSHHWMEKYIYINALGLGKQLRALPEEDTKGTILYFKRKKQILKRNSPTHLPHL